MRERRRRRRRRNEWSRMDAKCMTREEEMVCRECERKQKGRERENKHKENRVSSSECLRVSLSSSLSLPLLASACMS